MDENLNAPASKGDLAELKTLIKGDMAEMKTLIKGDMSEMETRIKGDMSEMETRIGGDLTSLETRIKGDITALEDRVQDRFDQLTETMRDGQTEILRAFHGFTQTVQTRFLAADDTEAGIKKRLTVVEERLLEIEKKLNLPPAA